MRKKILFSLICMSLSCSLLTACDKGPDQENTHYSLEHGTEPEYSTDRKDPAGKTELTGKTSDSDWSMSEYESDEEFVLVEPLESEVWNMIISKRILNRVLSRFQNQCLEWYYSDCYVKVYPSLSYPKRLREELKKEYPFPMGPGRELYFRIWVNDAGTIYQIRCSDTPDFKYWFSLSYTYYPTLDQLTQTKIETSSDPVHFCISGSFTLQETFSNADEQAYEKADQQFHDFWDQWLTNSAATDLESPLKNAYLMPFSVEEDGSADLCIFLEEENGTWLMARPTLPRNRAYADDSTADGKRDFGWDLSWEYKIPLFIPNGDFYPGDYPEEPERDIVVRCSYIPEESEYLVENNESFIRVDMFTADDEKLSGGISPAENGDFLSKVPELAAEKLY